MGKHFFYLCDVIISRSFFYSLSDTWCALRFEPAGTFRAIKVNHLQNVMLILNAQRQTSKCHSLWLPICARGTELFIFGWSCFH